MPRPTRRRPGSPFYFRARVPADVQGAFGSREVVYSLRTADPAEAQRLHAEHLAKHLRHWQALREGPQPLTTQAIYALAGEWYAGWTRAMTEEPGEPGVWKAVADMLERTRTDEPAELERWFGDTADPLLREHGLVPDGPSRQRLLEALRRALEQASETLTRRSRGDYGPDAHADTFPAMPEGTAADARKPRTGGPTLWDLFDGWETEHRRNGRAERTIRDFRSKVQSLVSFLEQDNAGAVSAADVVRWKDKLLADGIGARTVSDKYLVAVRNLYHHAKANALDLQDPTEHVSVRYSAPRRTRERGFTEDETRTVLVAAKAGKGMSPRHADHTRRAVRWVPWVCAFTGARVTEITQLRKEDVETVSGVPCIRITPEAGSVKTGEYRRVPLHPQLVREGFLAFVEGMPEGPLFRTASVDAENMSKRVGDWVRRVAGITDPRLQPSHAWRHRFKTLCRNHGVPSDLADHIQGHASTRAAEGYGEFTVTALDREMRKLPEVEEVKAPGPA